MIVLIVLMKVKPGTEAECIRLMKILEEHTRREPGCVQYITHQSEDDPQSFAFYEQYKSRADLDSHWDSEHFSKYVREGLDKIVVSRQRELFHTIG